MMMARYKIPAAIIGALLSLHLLLFYTLPSYSLHLPSLHLFPSSYSSSSSDSPATAAFLNGQSHTPWEENNQMVPISAIPRVNASSGELEGGRRKANAVFVVLARNSDLWPFIESMKQMEDRFNWWAQYDYVFLNEEPFDEAFMKYTQGITKAKCFYGKIDHKDWFQPDWIDEEKATASRNEMVKNQVIYGHSVPYRNMCRYNSGTFFHHPLLADYDYYWRIDAGQVKFYCDINYDPFLVMQDEKKVYGFTISLFEYIETIPTLWATTKEFIKENPQYLAEGNGMKFLSDDGGETYNKCHFWSNFELGDLNFWRSEAYTKYFEHLDKSGGFYYERWGDAPVHSIGAALFAKKEQIHFFEDIGYYHPPFTHCPQGDSHKRGKCWCPPEINFDWEWYSCTNKYMDMFKE